MYPFIFVLEMPLKVSNGHIDFSNSWANLINFRKEPLRTIVKNDFDTSVVQMIKKNNDSKASFNRLHQVILKKSGKSGKNY